MKTKYLVVSKGESWIWDASNAAEINKNIRWLQKRGYKKPRVYVVINSDPEYWRKRARQERDERVKKGRKNAR